MSRVVVRYAPSPTGIPHIGNIRTALFNFLLAKNQNGQFILRIEDTDRKRFIPKSIPKIKESLLVLGLKWDGEEIYQSKRLNLYQEHLEILKKKQLTYNKEGAWYFKVEKSKKISWQDLLHGPINFSSDVIEDFVIVKSDGFPTYHFASVVDDHEMQVSHVMRGDEWISSTPKHLLLYQAFSWNPPKFIHLPPILGPDKKKLSKRQGARSVLEYIEDGYLPEALVNFLALLGWSPKGDRELFILDELIREFSLDRLNKNSPIFNIEKLNWFNKKYLQKYTSDELIKKIRNFSKLARTANDQHLAKISRLVCDRLTTLADFDSIASIFFEKGKEKPPQKSKIENARKAIESIITWDEYSIGQVLDEWIASNHFESSDFKNTLRLSVFADNTPPIYQSLAVLSKEEVINRIDDAIKKAK
ncbi:MAG: glutamate--tRNA ligase [Candidatus Zambryskibacteria bacterium RIFCSPHIGHO2_02_38_10.5]|uniref:Glutamate--tRNA ligase n=1 Tax=Candidatus Zambryskibacteria bacterium RIFCSPHIGHO2_02_38_10.5 TaxID=1802742 RepID=A0A1G2T6C1_9BACT|nr:MAG: glutamate--tRNA ligase [Candidatus Zambryskibacteria bacterium RIFCSPHIGHO2_02_38_10.5]